MTSQEILTHERMDKNAQWAVKLLHLIPGHSPFRTALCQQQVSMHAHVQLQLRERQALALTHEAPFVQATGVCTLNLHKQSCAHRASATHTESSPLPPPPVHQARKIGDCCPRPILCQLRFWQILSNSFGEIQFGKGFIKKHLKVQCKGI